MTLKVNSSKIVHRGKIFDVVQENISLPNGVKTDIDIIRHPGAATMVPLNRGNVFLVRQYRHPLGEYILEVPAGTCDAGETPLACARREIVEEVGYSALTWKEIGIVIPSPGYSDERLHVYLATDLKLVGQKLDQDELIEVCEIGFDKAIDMVYAGEIRDAKSIASLLLADRHLKAQGV